MSELEQDIKAAESQPPPVLEGEMEPLTQQQVLEQFLSKEENRQQALRLADQIQQCVGRNWFSLGRLVKKSSESKETAFQKLQLCRMFNLVEQKIGNHRDGVKNIRQPLFKVTIAKEDRIKALQQIVQYHRDQIEHFELEIKQLNS